MFTNLRTHFLTGILITAPLGVTIAVAWWVVNFVDDVVIPLIPDQYNPARLLGEALGVDASIPGLGIVVLVVAVTLAGALTAGLLGRVFVQASESVLNRMPVVRTLYSAVKQILETILRNQSKTFQQAVLVQYPREGLWAIAFVTSTTQGELERMLPGEHVSVFLPTTPNPTSGFLLFVPCDQILELEITVEDAIKMVISAGIVTKNGELSGS